MIIHYFIKKIEHLESYRLTQVFRRKLYKGLRGLLKYNIN